MKKTVSILIFFLIITFQIFAEWTEVKKWDLQIYSDATWSDLAADTVNWKANGKNRFDSKAGISGAIQIKGANIVEMDGILFPELNPGDVSIRRAIGLQLGSNNKIVTIPNRFKNEKIEIVFSSTNSTSERGISGVYNMTGELGNTIAPGTFTFIVMDDGDIAFNYSAAGGIVLKSIAVYVDNANPAAPALYRVSGNSEQNIRFGQLVSDITYNWGNTATSASIVWESGLPAGLSVTINNEDKTVSISGKPASAGIYNYSIVAADGIQNTSVLGKITVNDLPANRKLIAYITDTTLADAADVAITEKLRDTYEVDIVVANPSYDKSLFDAYDALVLAAFPGSSSVPLCLKGIDKPLVTVKPYMLNIWGWAVVANMETHRLNDVPAGVVILEETHPIFVGLHVSKGGEMTLAAGSKHDKSRILTPVVSWIGMNESNIIVLAAVPSGAYNYMVTSPLSGNDASGRPVIFEIKPGAVMSDGVNSVVINHNTIHIGVSEQASEYLTPEFLTVVKNSVDYVLRKTNGK